MESGLQIKKNPGETGIDNYLTLLSCRAGSDFGT